MSTKYFSNMISTSTPIVADKAASDWEIISNIEGNKTYLAESMNSLMAV